MLRLKTAKGDANAYSERRERPSLGARGHRFQQNTSSVNDSSVKRERPEAERGATAFNKIPHLQHLSSGLTAARRYTARRHQESVALRAKYRRLTSHGKGGDRVLPSAKYRERRVEAKDPKENRERIR